MSAKDMARAKFCGYSLLRIVSVPSSAAQKTVSITVWCSPAASISGISGVPAQTAFPTMPWCRIPWFPEHSKVTVFSTRGMARN